MSARQGARICLLVLCGYAFFVGFPAAVFPHAFYEDFPFFAHWVDRIPPYNEHLVSDTGALFLGYAVLFAWAAWRPERTLVLAVCSSFMLVALLHFAYHATHLEGFGTADALAELLSLGSLLVPAAVAIYAASRPVG